MKNVDCCIISFAKTPTLQKVTEKGIETLLESEKNIKFNIFVVESNKEVSYDKYKNTTTIYTDLPFNYNSYLNLAREKGNSEYVALLNNDLTYEKGWASFIIDEMEKDKLLLSASPLCPQLFSTDYFKGIDMHYGYTVRVHIAGWAIFQKREIYSTIGQLDTGVDFWWSDNLYAIQLMTHKIRHALVVKSVVNHHCDYLGATGSSILDKKTTTEYTLGQNQKFLEAKKKYIL